MSEVEETYEYEGPKCPHCGRQYTADDPVYYDEMNFTEMECDGCGVTFNVQVHSTTAWLCSAKPAGDLQIQADQQNGDGDEDRAGDG